MAEAKKPSGLIYGLNETPPPAIIALNGMQHVGLVAINLVYPVLIFRAAGVPADSIANFLALGMLVLGIATFLQVGRFGPVGSGYMCPATFTATYFVPSLLAAKVGGAPLVFGMTVLAGVLETALAPLLNRLRAIFPPEILGLIIVMIGCRQPSPACARYSDRPPSPSAWPNGGWQAPPSHRWPSSTSGAKACCACRAP
jgi:xanthine permease XanP